MNIGDGTPTTLRSEKVHPLCNLEENRSRADHKGEKVYEQKIQPVAFSPLQTPLLTSAALSQGQPEVQSQILPKPKTEPSEQSSGGYWDKMGERVRSFGVALDGFLGNFASPLNALRKTTGQLVYDAKRNYKRTL